MTHGGRQAGLDRAQPDVRRDNLPHLRRPHVVPEEDQLFSTLRMGHERGLGARPPALLAGPRGLLCYPSCCSLHKLWAEHVTSGLQSQVEPFNSVKYATGQQSSRSYEKSVGIYCVHLRAGASCMWISNFVWSYCMAN